uniref:Uncharacterized protein n=1 Tax=Tanacetum cinerariifolium TaxID=118510 RepID=A0A6L2JE23_TANCI|nr:hypothetical protein [Tanacetum cinerariifolium]
MKWVKAWQEKRVRNKQCFCLNVTGIRRKVQREITRSQNHPYKSSSHRSGGHRPHGPSMNPRRPIMNGARPYKSFFIQSPSYETRPFLKSSAVKTSYRAPWVHYINRYDTPVNRKFSTGYNGLLYEEGRYTDFGRIQPLPDVQGKGKEKDIDEQVAHDLLTLLTPKNKSPVDQFIFQRRTPMLTEASRHAESTSLDAELALTDSETKSDNVASKIGTGDQDEGQAGPNPGDHDEGQAGPNLGQAELALHGREKRGSCSQWLPFSVHHSSVLVYRACKLFEETGLV